jgi:hypothetical protein
VLAFREFLAVVVLCVAGSSGCASELTKTYTPDGRKGYIVHCGFMNWGSCIAKAGRVCGEEGYTDFEDARLRISGSMLFACGNEQ